MRGKEASLPLWIEDPEGNMAVWLILGDFYEDRP